MEQVSANRPLWGRTPEELNAFHQLLGSEGGSIAPLGIKHVQIRYPGDDNGVEFTRVQFPHLTVNSDLTYRNSSMGFSAASLNGDEVALMLNLYADISQRPIGSLPTWIRTEDSNRHPLRLLHISSSAENTLTVNTQLSNLFPHLLRALNIDPFPLDDSLYNPGRGPNHLARFLIDHIPLSPEAVTTTLGTMTEKDLARIATDDLMLNVMPWLRHLETITNEMRQKAAQIQAIRNILWRLGDQLVYREPAFGSTDWDRSKNWPVPREV